MGELQALSLAGTAVQDLSPLSGLKKLVTLKCNDTQVNDLTPISNLTSLQLLQVFKTPVSDLSPLAKLTGLKTIFCYETQVSDLSVIQWQDFQQLTTFSISHTPIRDISPLLPLVKKGIKVKWKLWEDDAICVEDCVFTNPPEQIVKQGNEAILLYFKEKEKQGEEKLYEAKIVIVGAGESGKTTLIRKLLDPAHPVPNPDDKRTEGIRITSFPLTEPWPVR